MNLTSFKEIIKSDNLVLNDFTTEWCGPCETKAPVNKNVSIEVGDRACINKVQIDKNPSTENAYQVRSVPTFLIYKNDKIMWRASATLTADSLIKELFKYYVFYLVANFWNSRLLFLQNQISYGHSF